MSAPVMNGFARHYIGEADVARIAAAWYVDHRHSHRSPVHHDRRAHNRIVPRIAVNDIGPGDAHVDRQTGAGVDHATKFPATRDTISHAVHALAEHLTFAER